MRGILLLVASLYGAMIAGGDAASDQGREQAVSRARELVARELSTRVERIVVSSVEPAQWPDSALGCPVAGMQYAQVVTDGFRVRLSTGGREYEVHVAGTQAVLCPDVPGPAKPEAGVRAVETARAAQVARRELAKRLGIPLGEVKLATVREIDAATAADGCVLPSDTSGRAYEIRMTANGSTYRYRARGGQAAACSPEAEK